MKGSQVSLWIERRDVQSKTKILMNGQSDIAWNTDFSLADLVNYKF